MSDTPRTDAAAVSSEFVRREMDYYAHKFVLADFARQLERELAEARKDAERLNELQRRYIGADFMYGDDKRTVLLFDWSGRSVTKDLRVAIDAAVSPPPTSDPPE